MPAPLRCRHIIALKTLFCPLHRNFIFGTQKILEAKVKAQAAKPKYKSRCVNVRHMLLLFRLVLEFLLYFTAVNRFCQQVFLKKLRLMDYFFVSYMKMLPQEEFEKNIKEKRWILRAFMKQRFFFTASITVRFHWRSNITDL